SLKTLYRKRTVIWPFYFYTIIRTLSYSSSCLLLLNLHNEKFQQIQFMT
ncbi:VOC family protein, partial [Staphylococcus aureus]